MIDKKPLVIIAGPTAIGKTEISIKLAQKINGEIISADSMQVYRGMDIGTAKITKDEMEGIKHYLIDILEPEEDFNVVAFKEYATEAINNCLNIGKIPIIAGGTGFYIQSILYDIDFTEASELPEYRNYLSDLAKENGTAYIHELLKEIDVESYNIIKSNDEKRIIRALEYYKQTGEKISEHNKMQREKESAYNECYFFLNDDRIKIYDRINMRVDSMIEHGLVEEVTKLAQRGLTDSNVSMRGLGYKEIYSYLQGDISLDEAIDIIKRDTRHFAKRQLTWSKREKNIIYINKSDSDTMLEEMMIHLKHKGIIEG